MDHFSGGGPSQLDGLKIRYASSYGDILATFGATPVALSLTKSYEALDSGLIDCTQAYGYLVKPMKLNEVANNFVIFDAGTLQSFGLVMNLDAFEALSEDTQAELLKLGRELTEYNASAVRKSNQGAIAGFAATEDDGVKVSYLTSTAKTDLQEASNEQIDKWLKEAEQAGIDGQSLLDAYKTLLAENLKKYGES
ncbi:MAG: TRAP transporter substrate-binding protein DctP [Rhodobacteraceae bacterium]|nr:TRAP transporter substrate-binding protein DctP [Paracoccaceae bacterium]